MKVGDRVKIVDTDYSGFDLRNGQTGVIKYVHSVPKSSNAVYGVSMDNGHRSVSGTDGEWNFFTWQIEVI